MIKEKKWNEIKEEVDNIVTKIDKLRIPVDEGIKEIVIALRAHGFPTITSCEGHPRRANSYPKVVITLPDEKDSSRLLVKRLEDLLI